MSKQTKAPSHCKVIGKSRFTTTLLWQSTNIDIPLYLSLSTPPSHTHLNMVNCTKIHKSIKISTVHWYQLFINLKKVRGKGKLENMIWKGSFLWSQEEHILQYWHPRVSQVFFPELIISIEFHENVKKIIQRDQPYIKNI